MSLRKWFLLNESKGKEKSSTRMGFEPTRAEHNGLAVHHLNHLATSSCTAHAVHKCVDNISCPLVYVSVVPLHCTCMHCTIQMYMYNVLAH